MGKRELLLVVAFVIVGAILYQATAPPAPEGSRGFSFTDMFRAARSEMGERNARRDERRHVQLDIPEQVDTLELEDFPGRIVIEGADRADLEATLEATLHGVDEVDLDGQAALLRLSSDIREARVVLTATRRETGARPDYVLTIHLPERLKVRVGGRGAADISGVAGLELLDYRGDVQAARLTGPVSGEHREGRAEFAAGATLDFETRRGTIRASAPAAVTLTAIQTDVEVMDAVGAVTINGTRSTLEIVRAGGPVTVTGTGGALKLREVRAAVDIDAERLTVSTTMSAAVPVRIAIRNDNVDVTLPAGGVTIEASTEGGDLRAPAELEVTDADGRRSAGGAVNGGGPVVSLNVQRGTLTVRKGGGT